MRKDPSNSKQEVDYTPTPPPKPPHPGSPFCSEEFATGNVREKRLEPLAQSCSTRRRIKRGLVPPPPHEEKHERCNGGAESPAWAPGGPGGQSGCRARLPACLPASPPRGGGPLGSLFGVGMFLKRCDPRGCALSAAASVRASGRAGWWSVWLRGAGPLRSPGQGRRRRGGGGYVA